MDQAPEWSGGEWISITDAASRLTAAGDPVDRSTLSRYLKQHGEALATQRDGKSNLVEWGALQAHRGENIRVRGASAPQPAPTRGSPAPTRFAGTQSDGAARKATAEASLKEMDLAERQKALTPTGEVDRAGRNAVALMQSAFERAVETTAPAVALRFGWDERKVRIVLKEYARNGLEDFNRNLLEAIAAMQGEAVAPVEAT